WGEAAMATPQLLAAGGLDYIVYDYLAEITMSIMARAHARDQNRGFATDFIDAVLQPHLADMAAQGVKLISNAGGINPQTCAAAATQLIDDAGLDLTVAVVSGDDLMAHKGAFADRRITEMFSDQNFPDPKDIASINAYLGAFPIAQALALGADIVITGRCVDSAVTLGACIDAFGWKPDEFDRLAGGSLAGHILECGPQATGGNFTDWHKAAGSLADIGYPIAEVSADGSFVCTKPENTGGLVTVATVAEQALYEIGDPQAYVLPDVVCDFSSIRIEQQGPNRVLVRGAAGYTAPAAYKVCATYADGFRGGQLLTFNGFNARSKASVFADAAIARANKQIEAQQLGDFTETSIEILGGVPEKYLGSHAGDYQEVTLKIAARHRSAAGIGVLLKEITGLGLATPPGLCVFAGGRPKPSPVIRLFSFLLPKGELSVRIHWGGDSIDHTVAPVLTSEPAVPVPHTLSPCPEAQGVLTPVPLIRLAYGRSGDKGDQANIGIIARQAEYLPYIWTALTPEVVANCFSHFLDGRVERFLLPGIHAINFVLHDVLGGGGIASLRNDAQGKGYAQILLAQPIDLPAPLAERIS
ncbi:MAG TPA: terpene utilization protein AtuA, partial [Gammaproteobacteria bacterium]|nr:terpene utilization protein AtuA [Gammaproteobacteria bacterium]